jgi:hypothetical protein
MVNMGYDTEIANVLHIYFRGCKGMDLMAQLRDGRMIKNMVRIFNTYESTHIEIRHTDIEEPGSGAKVDIIINM